MKKNIQLLLLLLIAGLLSTCDITNESASEKQKSKTEGDPENLLMADYLEEDVSSAALYAINASQYGVSYRETMILLQNRMGLRIEYCVDRSNLQIWISPQVGKSLSYLRTDPDLQVAVRR